jgi:DNA invertase Pin-like site-specific DNA recombinase
MKADAGCKFEKGQQMAAYQGKFVAYFRVSTDKQGKSGLGLEAQREAVLTYLDGGRWSLVHEFVEVESGKRNDRPEMAAALAACKKHKARLIIAKLDRLSRNLAFIATLMDSGVEFIAVDNPHANKRFISWRPWLSMSGK